MIKRRWKQPLLLQKFNSFLRLVVELLSTSLKNLRKNTSISLKQSMLHDVKKKKKLSYLSESDSKITLQTNTIQDWAQTFSNKTGNENF